jgi:outer membrane protein
LNVANAFLQVLFNKRFKVQKEQLGINEKQYARSEELVNAGSIPRGDLWILKRPLLKICQNVAADNAH